MMREDEFERATAASLSPLFDEGVLREILAFVPHHWLFVGPVCSYWAAMYAKSHAKSTSRAAAFASAATVILAHACGLDFFKLQNQTVWYQPHTTAGRYGSCESLQAAHALGLPFTAMITKGAALSGDLAKLRWLRTQHSCPWFSHEIAKDAAQSGNADMLVWLQQQGISVRRASLP
jgi:hypothetical protein